MENYIGIDLGTTNSAICTYDKDYTPNPYLEEPRN